VGTIFVLFYVLCLVLSRSGEDILTTVVPPTDMCICFPLSPINFLILYKQNIKWILNLTYVPSIWKCFIPDVFIRYIIVLLEHSCTSPRLFFVKLNLEFW